VSFVGLGTLEKRKVRTEPVGCLRDSVRGNLVPVSLGTGTKGRVSTLPIRSAEPTNVASLLDGINDVLILSRLTS